MSIGVLAIEQALVGEVVDDVGIAVLDVATVEQVMGPGDEGAVYAHGVLSREADLHSEVVVLLAVHHCGMDHARPVSGGHEVGSDDRPGALGVAPLNRVGEQRAVGLADELRARELVDDLDLVAQDVCEQVLGENHLLSDLGTATALPRARRWLSDADAAVGDIRADGEPHVARQGPRRGRPSEDGGIIVDEFELDVDSRLRDLLVAQRDLVGGVASPRLGAVGQDLVSAEQQPLFEHPLE